ncbi:MPHOSPH8 (predicted), partial [Pycnogonum litorale]
SSADMSNAVAVNLSTNMAENNKGSSPNDMEHSNLDTSLTEEDVYEVEEIVGVRKIGSQIQYRVRWSGYGSQHDTWEPKENLLTCEDLIDNYMNDKKNKPSSVKRKKNAGSWVMLQVQDSEQADSETFLRDPFWKNLEAGRINVFDGGDMYSKVKGRAARPESYNENALLKRRLSGIYDPQSDSSSKISTRSAKFSPCSSKSDHFKFTDGKFQSGSSVDEQSPQMTSRNVKSKPDNKKTPVKRNRKKKTNSMGQSRKRGKKRKNKPDLLLNAENVTADNDPIALVDITSDNNKRNDESESEAGELNDGSATVSSENKESVEKELSNDEIMPLNCEPGKSGLVSDLVSHADVKVESKFADKSSKLMIDTSTDDNSYSAIVKTESNVTSDVENSTDAMTKSEAIPASEIDKEEGDDVAQVVDAETIDCVQSEEASIKYFSEDELLLVDSYGASSGDEKNSEISEQLVEDSDSNRKSTGDIKDEDEDDDDEMSAFTSSMKYISMEPSKTKFG